MESKNQSVQALRGLGFLSVFLYHAGIIPSGGGWGVSIFFSLSGFLLMIHNYERKMHVSFLENFFWACRKIGKLYPLHIFMSVVALPLLVKQYIGRPYFGLNVGLRIVVNFLLVQSWLPWESLRYSMNNLSWFLSCMLFLYFIFPVLHRCIKKLDTNKKRFRAVIAIWLIMLIYGWGISRVCDIYGIEDSILKGMTYNFPLYRVGDFFIGSLFGAIYVTKSGNKYTHMCMHYLEGMAVVIFIAMAVIDWEAVIGDSSGGYPWWKVVIYIFPAVFVVWNYYNETRDGICMALAKTPLTWLGDISGQTYLIHELVLIYLGIIMRWLLDIDISGSWKVVRAGLGFVVTLIIACGWIKVQNRLCEFKH